MSLHKAAGLTFALPLLAVSAPVHAQFGNLLDSLKNKAADAVRQQMDSNRRTQDQTLPDPEPHSLIINQGYDFTPGTELVIQSNFADAGIGSMPTNWKTNGSGDIVTVQGIPGKWLRLQNFATYKLSNPPQLPLHFTVQFDIVVAADATRDIGFIYAGFAKDNSVRSYIQDAYNDGAINVVTFGYGGDSNVASSATGYNHADQLDMGSFANRVMHVSITVDGDAERIYIDRNKIADAKLFNGNIAKYFFISAPVSTEHDGKVLFGNFRIDKFS